MSLSERRDELGKMSTFLIILLLGPFYTSAVDIGWVESTMTVNEDKFLVSARISRSNSSGQNTVAVSTKDITAEEGKDYGTTVENVVFRDGDSEKSFTFVIFDDDDVEETETFQLILSSTDATIISSTINITINMDDKAKFSIEPKGSITEGQVYEAVIIREQCEGCDATIELKCTATGDTATSGTDFTVVTNEVVTFTKYNSTMKCKVPTINDSLVEGEEKFKISISSSSPIAEIGLPEHTATIEDDDRGNVKKGRESCFR
ncbi:adhesion G-protein coupled receptor V1-like [Nematostella vectensis]|uniref:adhesion G-protein coupled receptor V1-like n=1 Tax=Nematostella vectensis TaxID=45351 RepID=UPI002076F84C|nr:adhesion G-protein coupled receptor V1-like [Nematostella vectensis]